jgi:hypothetical protein
MTKGLCDVWWLEIALAVTGALASVGVRPTFAEDAEPRKHIPVRAADTYEGPSINVLDFGAKGDGRTDDTEAIRAAVQAAFERRQILQHPQYGYFVSFAEVYFPSGYYLVSDTVDISYVKLRGENYAAIEQKDPDKDVFYAHDAWRQIIEGLTFLGGQVQLNLGNPNVDTGHVTVRDCHFKNSRAVAVQMRQGSNSTFFKVENCVFIDCAQVLINYCDQAHLRDCWISTKAKKDNKAVIENYGCLTCQNILGVPRPSHNDQRWIDNHGMLSCKVFRFGGEGAGFTPVVNYARYAPQEGGPSILLDDCWVSALGNNKRACAVYLEEIPNQIVIRNCMLGGVPAVKVNPKLDLRTYFNEARPGMLHFDVANNVGEFAGDLPTAMIQAAAQRKPGAIDYGSKQLNPAATKKALAAAVAAAQRIPSAPEPGVMTFGLPPGQEGHLQVTDPAKYVDITPKTHAWDLADRLDGLTERCSAYLALAPAGDDVVLMSRMDQGSWPHVRIRNVTVDLDQTPFLTWRVKDNGVKGGHQAMKVINNATEEMTLLVENSNPDQYGYFACDLRKALDIPQGKVNVDLKFYLCGSRCVDVLTMDYIQKGEFFLIDFLRLEAE